MILFSPAPPINELPQSRSNRMPIPLKRSRTEICLSPNWKEIISKKSKVTERIPKLWRAASPNKKTAIVLNQARLVVKIPTRRYAIHAKDTLKAGLMKSSVGRLKDLNPDIQSNVRSRKMNGEISLSEFFFQSGSVRSSLGLRNFLLVKWKRR